MTFKLAILPKRFGKNSICLRKLQMFQKCPSLLILLKKKTLIPTNIIDVSNIPQVILLIENSEFKIV